ncbi:WXG100 family type VII secretion target [Streptomyces sp. Rer75]|uniref:WXG100 family type VII secretion target n=1 Tax=unclassified Streptomyces TaxID=2593676 RepID=UPI0015D05283|nr:WXG100 family type VII secretion target [Streptomyces sp. Rer75]QLH24465.1 WXG100 family type VII secretion target [Streptomyces sp. Rer75]
MEITYEGVVNASTTVKSEADQLKTDLDTIMRKCKAVSESWSGEAQRAFNERQHEWNQRVNHLHTTLVEISKRLLEATEGYKANDHRQGQRFAQG